MNRHSINTSSSNVDTGWAGWVRACLHGRASRWSSAFSASDKGWVEQERKTWLRVSCWNVTLPDAAASECLTSISVGLASHGILFLRVHRSSELVGDSVSNRCGGCDTSPVYSSFNGYRNLGSHGIGFTTRVSDWLSELEWNWTGLIAMIIAPVAVRGTPSSRSRSFHSKLLLGVTRAGGNLRITGSRELEAFIRCLVLENISVSSTFNGSPKLVFSTSARVCSHISITASFFSLKAPVSLLINDPSVFIEGPNLSGSGLGAGLIVYKKRSALSHIAASVHLDTFTCCNVGHSTTGKHSTKVIDIEVGIWATAWTHTKRTGARVVCIDNHAFSIGVFDTIEVLGNTISFPSTLWIKGPLLSVTTTIAQTELNTLTISIKASALFNITQGVIWAVLIELVTGTVAVLSMKASITRLLRSSLNASTPLVIISS